MEIDLRRQAGSRLRAEASAQDEHELGDVFAGDLAALLALEAEAALLQDADRGDVVLGHVRVEWTLGHEVQESGERPGRDTVAPASDGNQRRGRRRSRARPMRIASR